MNTNESTSRRQFIHTVGYAGAALAALPGAALRAADATPKTVLALVGCAHIHTPGFIGLLSKRPDVRVKYVWDANPAIAAKRAPQLEAQVPKDVNEIWGDPEVKAVVICSETFRHPELVAAAAKAGKHMFVEKPLGFTGQESRAMAQAIEQAHLLFTTGYFMRTIPQHLLVKELVAKNAFGKITRVGGWNCHNGSLGGWFDDKPNDPANSWRWMADPKQSGVGGFGDLGTHSLDILMWLFGDVASVTAEIKVITARYGECDESGLGMLEFKNGISGTLTAGWVDVANPITLLISGTEGHALILNGDLYLQCKSVEGADGKQPWKKLPAPPKAPLDQFCDAVGGQKDLPLVAPSEAAARVSVMAAMYEASKKHAWVTPA
jgi:predicted dehydrogenase